MAQKVQVILIDDVDGGAADETLGFALEGVTYEIDLASHRADQLRAALEPWIKAGRRVSTRRSSSPRGYSDAAKIRAWAVENGHSVPTRGRIPGPVREAYEAAN